LQSKTLGGLPYSLNWKLRYYKTQWFGLQNFSPVYRVASSFLFVIRMVVMAVEEEFSGKVKF